MQVSITLSRILQRGRPSMQTVLACPGGVKDYMAGFDGGLASAPRTCTCGGFLKGHGSRERWIASLEGVVRVRIRRMRCKACGGTVSLLPELFHPFVMCARDLAGRIRSIWQGGLQAMRDVRDAIARGGGPALATSSMYRWARLAA
jgi:hypothetical protein